MGVKITRNFQKKFSYLVMSFLVLSTLILIFEKSYFNVLLTVGMIILISIPTFSKFNAHLPPGFNISLVVFVFFSIYLGEILKFYETYAWWDLMLHFLSGIMLGMLGFMLVYMLNKEKKIHFSLNPGFIALFAFSFSMALAGVWEVFEFFMDTAFGLNMLKSGILDTMGDLTVALIGSLVVAVSAYLLMIHKTGSTRNYITRLLKN